MIRNSSLVAAILYFLYHAALTIFNPWPFPVSLASQLQDNLVNAQSFIYDSPDADCVIVGSSLAARLDMGLLPQCQNIALGALGSIDGLTILNRLKLHPKLLVVESNNLLVNEASTQWVDDLLAPGIYPLREFFPGFLARNRPVNIVMPIANKIQFELTRLFGAGRRNARTDDTAAITPQQEAPVSKELFAELLHYQQTAHSVLPDAADIERRISRIESTIKVMEASGVQVLFVEMPVYPTLFSSAHYTFTRSLIADRFVPDELSFFRIDPTVEIFSTTDGVHLDVEGVNRYSLLLAEWLERAANRVPK